MAITKLKRGSASEQFTSEAPDAKPAGPKLRGRRQPIALALPPELIAQVDAMAAEQERSRTKMMEILLRGALERARGQAA
jgi:hypothetical protein